MSASLEQQLKDMAHSVGFEVTRITEPYGLEKAAEELDYFIDQGRHGEMAWMKEKQDRRSDPRTLWPDVNSIIMLGMNYGPDHDPMDILGHSDRGGISVYAQGTDYHNIIKKKLKQIARWFHQTTGAEVKVFVDTAPVMEKPLAEKAGIGWQGKHTNLVSRDLGSWLFLGSIFTTAKLAYDHEEKDHCGSCQNCLDICPTNAFPAPYQLDARRCISYLTIEYKGHIDLEFRKAMGNRIYGCDDCLSVCPWNKFARTANEAGYFPRPELYYPTIKDMLDLSDSDFRQVFTASPIKRIGRDYFIRNLLIAAGNSGTPELLPAIIEKLSEPAAVIRAMAVWAIGELASDTECRQLKEQYLPSEMDPDVIREWRRL